MSCVPGMMLVAGTPNSGWFSSRMIWLPMFIRQAYEYPHAPKLGAFVAIESAFTCKIPDEGITQKPFCMSGTPGVMTWFSTITVPSPPASRERKAL